MSKNKEKTYTAILFLRAFVQLQKHQIKNLSSKTNVLLWLNACISILLQKSENHMLCKD